MGTDPTLGIDNLASFVAATVGRPGQVRPVDGGLAVAATVAVANGYVNAAFRTDPAVDADAFLDGVTATFGEVGHPYVVWSLASDDELLAACTRAGGAPDGADTPAMVVSVPVPVTPGIDVRTVVDPADRPVFAQLCEDGYGMPGLAWLLDSQGCFDAPGATWAIASADGVDLSVACSHAEGATGGIYYVATPPEHRGRGAAAAVTAWLTNRLLDDGASMVTLQASDMGRPVYERLGFTVAGSFRRQAFAAPG